MNKYQLACMLNRPCDCMAEIHESGVDEHSNRIVYARYMVDDNMESTCIEHIPDGDWDDLDLVCSKCGKSWIGMNPVVCNNM